VTPMLAHGSRVAAGSRAERRVRHGLVAAEVSIALVLLSGAGLFVNSFLRLMDLPLGFEPENRVMMRIPVRGERYADLREVSRFSRRLIERSLAVPGVREAAVGTSVPLEGGPGISFAVSGQPPSSSPLLRHTVVRSVTPEFFSTLNMRLVSGRGIGIEDVHGAPRVAVVNEHLARRFFSDTTPLGKTLMLQAGSGPAWIEAGAVQIVGVFANIKEVGLNEVDFNSILLSLDQTPSSSIQLVVSTEIPPASVADPLRRALFELDPELPVVAITTMPEQVAGASRGSRFYLWLTAALAIVATILASAGIYALMAHAIQQRTREFGIRLALGAARIGILGLAVRQAVGLGLAGTALGVAGVIGLSRLIGDALFLVQGQHEGMLYGITLTDPLTLTAASIAVIVVVCVTGLMPARRATRIDPVVALRSE
jgi:putative ABC transport system permease protein